MSSRKTPSIDYGRSQILMVDLGRYIINSEVNNISLVTNLTLQRTQLLAGLTTCQKYITLTDESNRFVEKQTVRYEPKSRMSCNRSSSALGVLEKDAA